MIAFANKISLTVFLVFIVKQFFPAVPYISEVFFILLVALPLIYLIEIKMNPDRMIYFNFFWAPKKRLRTISEDKRIISGVGFINSTFVLNYFAVDSNIHYVSMNDFIFPLLSLFVLTLLSVLFYVVESGYRREYFIITFICSFFYSLGAILTINNVLTSKLDTFYYPQVTEKQYIPRAARSPEEYHLIVPSIDQPGESQTYTVTSEVFSHAQKGESCRVLRFKGIMGVRFDIVR